jgi:hypothetical protein
MTKKAYFIPFPDAIVTCNLLLKNLGKYPQSFALVDNIHSAFSTNAASQSYTPVYLVCLVAQHQTHVLPAISSFTLTLSTLILGPLNIPVF